MSKAFTLIEVLIIVAIIGIIAGAFFGTLKALQPSLRLGGATRDLVADIRYTQQLAVTEQVNHGIRFSTSTAQYQIIRYSTSTEQLLEKTLPSGVNFQQISGFNDSTALFNPYGSVGEAGSVVLVNIKEETKTIEIRPSGFVRVKN